jgi:mannosyltransferase OCH1-like enzyme
MGLASRKGKPEVIPKKIHQIWVKGELPAFKKFLTSRMRDSHPEYQYFLWT